MSDYTAVLNNWLAVPGYFEQETYVLCGEIINDKRGRFLSRQLIRTSPIKMTDFPIHSLKVGDIVTTENSKYLLGDKAT